MTFYNLITTLLCKAKWQIKSKQKRLDAKATFKLHTNSFRAKWISWKNLRRCGLNGCVEKESRTKLLRSGTKNLCDLKQKPKEKKGKGLWP